MQGNIQHLAYNSGPTSIAQYTTYRVAYLSVEPEVLQYLYFDQ